MIGLFSLGLPQVVRRDYGAVNFGTRAAGLEEGSPYRGQAPWIRHQKVCSLMRLKREVNPRL